MRDDLDQTMYFDKNMQQELGPREVLRQVYTALEAKGYQPLNQIVGYILSGDPAYITSYNNSRYLISRMERDELIEELVRFYVAHRDLT